MTHDKRRILNMLAYFGWSREDLAQITGYSKFNIDTNISRKPAYDLLEAVKRWELMTDHGKEIRDYSSVKIVEPNRKGWHNLSFHLLKCEKRFMRL